MKLIELSAKHFAIIAITLLIALPVCVFVAVGGSAPIYAWCYENFLGREARAALGFETGVLGGDLRSQSSWGITRVASGGAFGVAGVRVGDVPIRISYASSLDGGRRTRMIWRHGQSEAVVSFYEFLADSRGMGPVTFTVCAVESITRDHPCAEREITIAIPQEQSELTSRCSRRALQISLVGARYGSARG